LTLTILFAGLFGPLTVTQADAGAPQAKPAPAPSAPPVAAKKPKTITLHGRTIIDDYFWLREKDNPEVINHLKAENAWTEAAMKDSEPLRKKLYDEYLSRIKQTDLSVPYRDRNHWYYTRVVEGKQYPIFCRRKESMTAPEQVMLDVNELARGQAFMSATPAGISDDENLLAYISDTTGFREYMLSVKDLRTGKLLEDRTVKVTDVVWAADGRTLFYVTESDTKRPHKLWRHTLGQPVAKDEMVYEEKDAAFNLGVGRTRDRRMLIRSVDSADTSEAAYLPADTPNAPWTIVAPRHPGHEYGVDHREGHFYIRTNSNGAVNFKIMTCAVAESSKGEKAWTAFLDHRPTVLVEGIDLFENFLIISEKESAVPHLLVVSAADGASHRIKFPEPVYSCGTDANPDYRTKQLRLHYSSMTEPDSVFDYDLTSKSLKLLKRQEIPAGYNKEDYVSERTMAKAADGTEIPISLVYRKGLKKDGSAACLLYGYGSYGASMDVDFDPRRLSLLDRGMVFALAHIRGGSDMGRAWYDNGKLLKKKNTFSDFAACADHLVNSKWCDRKRLAIQGGSAGGLLVGATVNLRPDLCQVAVLEVPFVDVINTMLDDSLPLTTQEYLEWGNPNDPKFFEYMSSYCPYTNLRKGEYPAILVTTSLNDSQVMYHEPAKYVAKLRTLKTDGRPLLFKCNMDAGHGGASGRYDSLKEDAFIAAFVLRQTGCEPGN
jgi:oligopeptidase B